MDVLIQYGGWEIPGGGIFNIWVMVLGGSHNSQFTIYNLPVMIIAHCPFIAHCPLPSCPAAQMSQMGNGGVSNHNIVSVYYNWSTGGGSEAKRWWLWRFGILAAGKILKSASLVSRESLRKSYIRISFPLKRMSRVQYLGSSVGSKQAVLAKVSIVWSTYRTWIPAE